MQDFRRQPGHAQSLLRDWGADADVEVLSDSSAARAFASRRGLGHMMHVASRYLWLQERVRRRELAVKRIGILDSRSDFLTKALAAQKAFEHLQGLGFFHAPRDAKGPWSRSAT